MICPKCGVNNSAGVKMCEKCGAELVTNDSRMGRTTASKYAVLGMSILSAICLCMRWFDIRYLELFSEKASFSAVGLLHAVRKFLSYLDPSVSVSSFMFTEEFGLTYPIIWGMGVCGVLFILGIVQLFLKNRADMFCAASIFSIPFGLAAALSFPGSGLVMLTPWVWAYIILNLVNLCVFYKYTVS